MQVLINLLLPFLTGHSNDLIEFFASLGNDQLKKLVKARFATVAPEVVADLEADGMAFDKKTDARTNPPDAYIAGIMFRLLKEGGMPGGQARDIVRDKHGKTVIPRVAAQITPETSPADAVRLTSEEFAESLF